MEVSNDSMEKFKCEQLLINIDEKLELDSECCIYRVPQNIRKININAYSPQFISIGPFHHGKKELKDMEKQKIRYKKKFGQRITIEWDDFITLIKDNEQDIRNCYAETFKFESFEFITMILYDAIFIIELLLSYHEKKNDFLLDKPCIRYVIWLDLQLLENQLPYFILKKLYKLAKVGKQNYPGFFSLSYEFFSDNTMFKEKPNKECIKHFLDMRRHALIKTYPNSKPGGDNSDLPSSQIVCASVVDLSIEEDDTNLPCALNLQESGVKFKSIKGESLLDIRFSKSKQRIPCFNVAELQIPKIVVDDNTECLFRNLMALEQCHYPSQAHICNYIDLMDYLIDKEKDVELLVKEKIICNNLGENVAIAKMFNKLCLEITVGDSCYSRIVVDLKAHYDNRWNHTKATLKSVYFSNLWRGTGTVAAIALLLLTLAQTVFSVLQVFL